MRTEPRGTTMSEYGRLAELTINERIAEASRSRAGGRQSRSGRHLLARRLHDLADRLDV